MSGTGDSSSRWARLKAIQPVLPIGLLGLWMLLSGKLSIFHLSVGVVLVVAIVWQAASMAPIEPLDRPRPRFWKMLPYGLWLFWQMLVSALQVARVILAPERHLDPQMVAFDCRLPSLLSGVILSGSITLTPGTVTVDLDGDRFVVHALTRAGAEDVLGGDMARRVARLSSDEPMSAIQVVIGPSGKGAGV